MHELYRVYQKHEKAREGIINSDYFEELIWS